MKTRRARSQIPWSKLPRPCVYVVASSLLLASARDARAESLTRGSAIQRALSQNPQIAASRAREAQAAARIEQAQAARLPEVTITVATGPSLQADRVSGTAVQSTENAYGDVRFNDLSVFFGGQLQVLQPIYTFGKIDLREDAAEHEVRARKAQTDITRTDVARQVAELYESYLFARDVKRFFDETRHWLQRTLEDTQGALGNDPAVSEQDVLRLRTALSAAQLAINQASAGVEQARAGLGAYLGLEPQAIAVLEQALKPLPNPTLTQAALVRMALNQRPELRALKEGRAAFEKLAQAEEADGLPDFFALANVSGAYTPGRDLVDTRFVVDPLNHFVPGAMVGMRWRYQGGIAARRADVSEAQAEELARTHDWAELGMPAEVTKAHQDLLRAQSDIKEAEAAVKHAKQWAVMASADYGIGLGSSRDVTDAAAAYARLRVAQIDAIFRHNVALAELARATGTLSLDDGRFYPTHDSVAPAKPSQLQPSPRREEKPPHSAPAEPAAR